MNWNMAYLILNVSVVGIFMAGCSPAVTHTPIATRPASASLVPPSATLAPSVIPSTLPAITPTRTASPTRTARPPTLTPTPTVNLIGESAGKIAYAACSNSEYTSCEIYVINVDGSQPIRLTNDTAWNCCPAWSPDGTQLAFIANPCCPAQGAWGAIYTINADGRHLTQLTDSGIEGENPVWSPDGTKIAFTDFAAPGAGSIQVINVDGSGLTRLPSITAYAEYPLVWSPDGTRIAFESHVYVPDGPSPPHDIYVLNVDGSGLTNLTANSFHDSMPAWSPDGTQIAFVSERDGNAEIYVMNADGSNPTNLTKNNATDDSPTWSPDGTKIVFVSNRDSNAEIYVMNVEDALQGTDGSGLTNLTNNRGGGSPAWSPDGTKIAFLSSRDGNAGIYVMNVEDVLQGMEGGNPIKLVGNIKGGVFRLAWSPPITHRPIQHPDCTSGWSRLTAGSQAKVSDASTTPNRVRAGPSTSESFLIQLYPGTVMNLIEGPICAEELVFWKVKSDLIPGGVGWTAEGDGREYYLQPHKP